MKVEQKSKKFMLTYSKSCCLALWQDENPLKTFKKES